MKGIDYVNSTLKMLSRTVVHAHAHLLHPLGARGLTKANQSILLVSRPPLFKSLCGQAVIIHYSICHFEGEASWNGVQLPGTTQRINKKEAWLAFQGNNEGGSGRLKQTRAVNCSFFHSRARDTVPCVSRSNRFH